MRSDVNYYRRYHVRHSPGASAAPGSCMWPGSLDIELVAPDVPTTDGGWAIEPDGLREALVRLTAEYEPPPIYVHENGAVFDDEPGPTGEIDDAGRVAYLDAHFRAAHAAMREGVDLRGFFVWSYLDNFEWAEGYAHRFGIVHVDFETLQRNPKASAHWYADLIKRGALDP